MEAKVWNRAYISFIGTREFSEVDHEIQKLYLDAVEAVVGMGYGVITGAARGADKTAASQALSVGGRVMLVLPWESYEQTWVAELQLGYPDQVSLRVYDREKDEAWADSVYYHHPNPQALSSAGFALHARNYGIIEMSKGVIAVPSNRIGGGGTGQGIRIAKALGKKLFDLSQETDRQELERFLLASRSLRKP